MSTENQIEEQVAPVESAAEELVFEKKKMKSNASIANDKFDWDAFESDSAEGFSSGLVEARRSL